MSAQESFPEDGFSGELAVSEPELAIGGLSLVTSETDNVDIDTTDEDPPVNENFNLTIADDERNMLDRMSQHRVLTAAEEVVLAKRIEKGDKSARQEFIENNYKLVISIAIGFRGRGISIMDLVQEGIAEGLVKAVDKFDHRRGLKFSTYATWWIRQACQRAVYNHSKTIRIPVHIRERQVSLQRAANEFMASQGRQPTYDELAYLTNLEPEQVEEALTAVESNASLNKKIGAEDDGEFIEMFPDDSDRSVGWEEVIDEVSRRELLHAILDHMDGIGWAAKRQAQVLRLRYGIGDDAQRTMTLAEVGKKIGISGTTVRQIEEEALQKLQKSTSLKEAMSDDDTFMPASEINYGTLLGRYKVQKLEGLSGRKSVIAYLLMRGKTNPEIAAITGLSEGAVKYDVPKIYTYLGYPENKPDKRAACRPDLEAKFKSSLAE